ncbi:MAG: hypothetical protein EOP08_01360, partial [Proteobacteria bacterium]
REPGGNYGMNQFYAPCRDYLLDNTGAIRQVIKGNPNPQPDNPLSFYFTLGQDDTSKWTVLVDKAGCNIQQGKPASGTADCVLKTSPEMFMRIVREGYTPGPAEFMTGAVKSNDVGLLIEFQRVFQLGEATS